MATEWNFDFKAEAQPITLKAGKYKLECWGAHGKVWGGDSQSSGGYSYGELTLKKKLHYMYIQVLLVLVINMKNLHLMEEDLVLIMEEVEQLI